MVAVAKELGLSRESLYKSLSSTGNPSFSTILKVLDLLGYKLQILPKSAA
jgi:probable addiction module antidote protein